MTGKWHLTGWGVVVCVAIIIGALGVVAALAIGAVELVGWVAR